MKPLPPELPLHLRALARVFNVMSRLQYGCEVPFMGEMLRTHGLVNIVRLNQAIAYPTKALERHLGARDAQLLCGFAAMWNGCDFCSVGHVLTANLHHFRDTGELFPVDEASIRALQRRRDPEVIDELKRRLSGARFDRVRRLVERQYELKAGLAEGETPDDMWLSGIIAMWGDWTNECSIVVSPAVEDVPPVAAIGKDKRLLERYRAARRAAAGANGSGASAPS